MWKLFTVSGGLLIATGALWVVHQYGHHADAPGASRTISPGVFPAQVTSVGSLGFGTPVPKRENTYGILDVRLTDSSKVMPVLDLTALSAPVVARPPNPGGDFAEPPHPEVYNLPGCGSYAP
jgi:hypothetical protein